MGRQWRRVRVRRLRLALTACLLSLAEAVTFFLADDSAPRLGLAMLQIEFLQRFGETLREMLPAVDAKLSGG